MLHQCTPLVHHEKGTALFFAAEFGTGQVFWSILWFALVAILIALCLYVVADIVRSNELSGLSKAIWVAVIVFVPYLGVFGYLMVHGDRFGDRQQQARLVRARTYGGPIDPIAQARLMK